MRKHSLLFILLASLFLLQCEEENNNDDEGSQPEPRFFIDRYNIKQVADGENVPVISYSDSLGNTTTFYGEYASNELTRITHFAHEPVGQNPVLASFSKDGFLNAFTEIDPASGSEINQVIVFADTDFTYLKDINTNEEEKIARVNTGSGDGFFGTYFTDHTSTLIDQIIEKNNTTLENIQWYVENQEKKKSAEYLQEQELAISTIVGAAVAGMALYKIITKSQDEGVKKITENSEIESESIGDLIKNACGNLLDDLPGDKKSSTQIASSGLMCSENQNKIKEILKETENKTVLQCSESSICVADCNGDPDGTATIDECGNCVGGNTGETACTTDCNGDYGGSATLDDCGNCTGGNTGQQPCEEDCNGDLGGTATIDECGNCTGGNTGAEPCDADCNGDPGGSAEIDSCGVCAGGNTGVEPCENDTDCNGDPGGTAYIDTCGACVGGNTGNTPCETDCNGTPGGTAYTDMCGNCVGGTTGEEPCDTLKKKAIVRFRD